MTSQSHFQTKSGKHFERQLASIMQLILTIFLLGISVIVGQIKPVVGLHVNDQGVYALRGGTIISEPGREVDGTILIRDGLIAAAGRKVAIPTDAVVIDITGKRVYAGFIDAYLPIGNGRDGEGMNKSTIRHWNRLVRPASAILENAKLDSSTVAQLHAMGFTTVQMVGEKGIFSGHTAIVDLTAYDDQPAINGRFGQGLNFDTFRNDGFSYPASLLGSIALMRQTFYDAQWYTKAKDVYRRHPQENVSPAVDHDLQELGTSLGANVPFVINTKNELEVLRASKIGQEFGIPFWVVGSGYEYRRLAAIKQSAPFMIIPLAFPEAPDVGTRGRELEVSQRVLRHWDMAPDNPRLLAEAGINFSLTSAKLKQRDKFKQYLIRAVARGYRAETALAALTTIPAERLGLVESHGKIEPGFVANLVVTDGDYFIAGTQVSSVWIRGKEYVQKKVPVEDVRGEWALQFILAGEIVSRFAMKVTGSEAQPAGKITWNDKEFGLSNLTANREQIAWQLDGSDLGQSGIWRFSGTVLGDRATGSGSKDDGTIFNWAATRTAQHRDEDSDEAAPAVRAAISTPLLPDGAYGRPAPPARPENILVKNATIWTSGPAGVLHNSDLLIKRGEIAEIGKNLSVDSKDGSDYVEIDGTGKHVTAGLIDAHSHTAMDAINEGTQSVTAEVRTEDVINSDDISIYYQLAGGVTMLNGLHGSANSIGGQNATIKLRWGEPPGELLEKRAPQGIKFALGENVKRSNWSAEYRTRYPITRMGVDQIIRDAFQSAVEYKARHEEYRLSRQQRSTKIPPRRDLELDALVEVIEGKRLVHAHCYRQDEILNLMRIAEDYGFTIANLTHVLEGYKIASEIADHGAGASTFADWWAYKFEVYDAIPHNAALMDLVGANVAIKSDDDELATRLNTEAAKAVRYGGVSEVAAVEMITINPAKMMGVASFTGSLEPGKDGDFVIWSGHPLSTRTKCEQTWIEGRRYFDIAEDRLLLNQQEAERSAIIQRILELDNMDGEPTNPADMANPHRRGCMWGIGEGGQQ
ncbi:amidohydrolase family protein [Candidatus Neomarinimicrobiota bacterium]